MKRFALVLLLVASCAAALPAGPQPSAVRVWAGSLTIPTYAEGPANPNPPFDLFSFGRFNYPYPIRDALSDRREPVTWRTLHLENEYLRLTVLPDLGGHIYSCLDKRSGREMFYANTAIKKALIGYRGAWAALGVEFNFPVSHNWMSMSPVDFATRENADGTGSIWVGNTDQVYGMRWRVELRLHPGRAALEQKVDLYNAADVRHRYYWWSNAAVQAWDDSRLVYPTELMATHGFTSIETWPVDRRGRDLSVIRNQTDGPVSLFTYRTREPFVGVYHPRTGSGTVHVADPAELPVHKVWSWGNDRDAAFWRTALSDDESGYVELQAGMFRNQETYGFLEPQESVRFTELWLPVRDLGGITRANADAVLHMDRPAAGRLRVALDAVREVADARIRLTGPDGTAIRELRASLSPREVWRSGEVEVPPGPVTFEAIDGSGAVLIRHKEHEFDLTPAARVATGPQAAARPSRPAARSAGEFVDAGEIDELEGRRLAAMETYRAGLAKFPEDAGLLKAAGRLAVGLGWADASAAGRADDPSTLAVVWLQRAHARNTTDAELQYYLGLALLRSGAERDALPHLESARRFRATRVPATLQLARISSPARALQLIEGVRAEAPHASVAGALEVAALRRLGRQADALERARQWQSVDPTDPLLRAELTLLDRPDPVFAAHLAADANRLLDVADHFMAARMPDEAKTLLNREYPAVAPPLREPGAVAPAESPLLAYYRAALMETRIAPAQSVAYSFPNRRQLYAVLGGALQRNPRDPVARFLLGSQYLASGLVDRAIEHWQPLRGARPAIPTLHRNLGLALMHGRGDVKAARAVLEEGTAADPGNVDVYLALDGVLSAAGASPAQRAAALQKFPSSNATPSSLVFKLAIALAEAGDAAAAERLFHGRFFPREEGGTNVRTVYAQVLLTSARVHARGGRCTEALRVLDSAAGERPGLAFTAGGLADALGSGVMARQAAAIESQCGRAPAARQRRVRLEQPLANGGAPLSLALAHEARVRLGKPVTAAERRRLQEALDAATQTLDSGGTSSPGSLELARALLLRAVGRTAESAAALQRVFIYPDRNLSHAFARAASADRPEPAAASPAGDAGRLDIEKE